MNNFNLIYNHIKEKKFCKVNKDKPIWININSENFTSETLLYILERMKYLKKYKFLPLQINLSLGTVFFTDKITYIMLDMLIYDLYKTTNFTLYMEIDVDCTRVMHNGFQGTALFKSTVRNNGVLSKKYFIEEYEKSVQIEPNIYKRYYKRDQCETEIQLPSIIATDMYTILSQHYDDDDWIDDIGEVVAELIDNTLAHTNSDCFLDVDICDVHDKDDYSYKVLTIAVINFSHDRIFDKIKENIKEEKYLKSDDLYSKVYSAYEKHKTFLSDSYTEDDFFHVTAFQRGVTSRNIASGDSGTGLTTLIRNITGKTVETFSYALSGENIIFFNEDYLDVLEHGFIGFNKERDYINYPPAEEVINKSSVYIPGTIFQLSLVRKNNGNQN